MLEIIEYGKDQYEFPALIVLGCFDAIHVGHRELLKKAKLQAKINGLDLGVMMFKDGKSGKLLYSFEERVAMLEEFNVKFVLAIDFNEEFKKIAPLDFLGEIEDKINVKAYMSGKDFRFGAGAKGKASTLKNYAEDDENGVWYMNVKDVDYDGEKISTTLIKACLDVGDAEKAAKLLGREYSVTGEVVKGAGRGTTVVGFPTVNICFPEWKYPVKYGVYNVSCEIDGTLYNGVANFGTCPTFEDDRVALETYLEGYDGNLYGKVLTVNFVSYIRDIEKFSSAEELSAQVKSDVESTCESEQTAVDEVSAEETATEDVKSEEVATEVAEAEEVSNDTAVEEIVTEEVIAEETVIKETATEEVIAEEQQTETVEETAVCEDCEKEQGEEKIEGGETAND
ncbi:MAG: riboflavin biosynthesis protein RibF [Candidatus Coproplasma sp.]